MDRKCTKCGQPTIQVAGTCTHCLREQGWTDLEIMRADHLKPAKSYKLENLTRGTVTQHATKNAAAREFDKNPSDNVTLYVWGRDRWLRYGWT